MGFWKEYWVAVKKDWKKDHTKSNQMLVWILKNPIFSGLMALLFLLIVGSITWNTLTYVPPPPQPVMSLSGFWDALFTVQLPWVIWAIILLFLWLTKW